MKRILIALSLVLFAAGAFAQEAKKNEPPAVDVATAREMKVRMFEVHNRNPRDVADSIRLLGSGFGNSGVSVNGDLHTITVRDFPENIAAMEEAIKRLDRPAAAAPQIDLRISILIGSKAPLPEATPLPDELASVVKELKSTLVYSHYVLVAADMVHPRPGNVEVRNNGVADSAVLGAKDGGIAPYESYLGNISLTKVGDRDALSGELRFDIRFPFSIEGKTTWQTARFTTPVTVRDGQQLVVGTTSVGDKAVVVVMSAKFAAEK